VEKTSLGPILFKRLQITGSTLRSRRPEYQSLLVERFGQEVLPKISDKPFESSSSNAAADGKPIQVVIHAVYKMSEIVKAHQDMEGDASVGKIVIEID
jgi:tumor protein p53-inducible protein 3